MDTDNTIPFDSINLNKAESEAAAESFYELMNKRRSIRDFSDEDVSDSVIENILKTAGTAPSGAHKQPWMFCAIKNSDLKHRIRTLAEEEERINYESRMSERWKNDLEKFGTTPVKEFLDVAPWLIVVLRKPFNVGSEGQRLNNYYVNESVGIASGMLIAAIHNAGLVTLTHTPSPMDFLAKVLGRPDNEKPFLLLPVGYPLKQARIPNIQRKEVDEIIKYYR